MPLDQKLLDILACPEDKGPLYYLADDNLLYNPRTHRSYPIRDGIPVMLADESSVAGEVEQARIAKVIADQGLSPTFKAP
jgi:uncharacterized protein